MELIGEGLEPHTKFSETLIYSQCVYVGGRDSGEGLEQFNDMIIFVFEKNTSVHRTQAEWEDR